MHRATLIACFAFALLLAMGPTAHGLAVYAQVDKSKPIYVGDRFTLSIIIDGQSTPGQVDLSALAKYRPQAAGTQDHSKTSIRIVNGRRSRSVTKRIVMNYALSAATEGNATLPSIPVTVAGRVYRTNTVNISIVRPRSTDKLDVEWSVSPSECYVGQPLTLTVDWTIRAGVANFSFDVPLFKSDAFYFEEGQPLSSGQESYDIHGVPVLLTQREVPGQNTIVVSFRKTLIPKRAGRIVLDPIRIYTDMVVGQYRTNSFFRTMANQYERFLVQGGALQLSVRPLPEEGKPKDFYGLVGRYTISATATPTEVTMGDPITLTLKIGGNPYLKPVQWPELQGQQELAAKFKIPAEKASPTFEGGFKTFVQTIRAKSERVTEIPPIPLSYFDPERGAYVTAKTKPIELSVTRARKLTNMDMGGSGVAPVNREVEAVKKGLAANYANEDALVNRGFSPIGAIVSPINLSCWLLPLVAFLASCAFKLTTHSTPERCIAKHRRQAASKSIARLSSASSLKGQALNEEVAQALKFFVGERFDKTAASLTSLECYHLIQGETGENELAQSYRIILEQCEASQYSAAKQEVDATELEQAKDLVRRIAKLTS
ncbi:MAG: BatD family protein [Planctomycetes bacterium]|nr:BatD family protein [Planctomycetota bacterium]